MKAFLLLLLLALCTPLAAQDQSADPPSAADSERIEQLVETLESETARAEFLDNLRALLATEDQEETPAPTLFRRLLEFTASGDNAFAGFITWLNDMGLSNSVISRLLALLLLCLVIALAITLNRRLARLLNRALDSIRDRLHLSQERFSLYFKTQVFAGYVLGLVVFLYGVNELFGVWLTGLSADTLVSFVFTFLLIFLLFVTVWEAVNGVTEFILGSTRLTRTRQQTLLSVLRNFFMVLMLVMLGMVVLSELGIDIVPLLAGAGIVGIALGFGAQAMVKDFLNGFIVILEDLFQVGDVISVGGRSGVVEKITLRKVQLRNIEGIVYTVPFGEITIIDNLTKDFSYYLLDVSVAYREDVDAVIACLREVDERIRATPEFGPKIRGPLEVMGLEKFSDNAVVIRARTLTGTHDRWAVGREFNRLIKAAFDERGIEMPFPHRTLYFGVDKQGKAPAVHVDLAGNDNGIMSE